MILEKFEKQPADVQDYDMTFVPYILSMGELASAAHTIAVTVETGITLVSSLIAAGIAKAWISGGTSGNAYTVTFTITTAGGRVHQQEIEIKVKEYT